MEDWIHLISSAAVVVPCFSHQELISRHTGNFVCAVEPLDLWQRLTLRLADELFRITLEHWDYFWKLCGIDRGLICWEIITERVKNTNMQRENTQREMWTHSRWWCWEDWTPFLEAAAARLDRGPTQPHTGTVFHRHFCLERWWWWTTRSPGFGSLSHHSQWRSHSGSRSRAVTLIK